MKASYRDITELIAMEPEWFDTNGVPRYKPFHPDLCPNIYANEAVLYLIGCQNCKETFLVAEESRHFFGDDLASYVKDHRIHYGDPPIHDCTGDTMNSEPIMCVEFWRRDIPHDWQRVPELEGIRFDE